MTDEGFKSICANTASLAVLAHIRAASGFTAIGDFNNHPYGFGRWAFMHNGQIAHWTLIKQEFVHEISDDTLALVKGTTDSEHFGALIFDILCKIVGPKAWEQDIPVATVRDAVLKAIETTITIQLCAIQTYNLNVANAQDRIELEPSPINFAISDGSKLVATRFHNHILEQPPTLYLSTVAGSTLNSKFPGNPDGKDDGKKALKATKDHGASVIISSEPITYRPDDWKLIDKNTIVTVDSDMTLRSAPMYVCPYFLSCHVSR